MLNDIRNELIKMLFQKKNYVVIFGHLLMLGLCYLGFRTSKLAFLQHGIDRNVGLEIKDIMSYIDALFFARAALVPTYFIIFPIFICTIAGDIVAGEVQEGNLKLYASRAISRTRILMAKLASIFCLSIIYSIYFGLINIVIGWIFFGAPGVQLIYMRDMWIETDLVIMPLSQAVACYIYTMGYFAVSVMALGCLTLFFSTIFNRMTTATIAGLTVYFVCYIVCNLPFCEDIKPYLLSNVMNGISIFWLERLPVGRLIDNLCLIGLYISVFTGLSLATFTLKDIR